MDDFDFDSELNAVIAAAEAIDKKEDDDTSKTDENQTIQNSISEKSNEIEQNQENQNRKEDINEEEEEILEINDPDVPKIDMRSAEKKMVNDIDEHLQKLSNEIANVINDEDAEDIDLDELDISVSSRSNP